MTNLLFAPPVLGTVLSLKGLPGGGDKIEDRSPYANNGTITGATWARLPSGLWYLEFDGTDDYVDCGSHASLTLTTAVTIEAWVYPDTATGTYMSIMGRHNSATGNEAGYCLWIDGSDNLAFVISGDGLNIDSISTPISFQKWHHVAGVYDGSNIAVYLDGSPTSKATAVTSLHASTYDFLIGAQGDIRRYFDGYIALVSASNYARSALQIQNDFSQEKHLFGVW